MERTGAGRRFVIIAVVALLIVLALDAAVFFMMPPLDTVRPPTNTPGPSPTPRPTNTPFPTPTEIPCEPQVWWDANRETIDAFFTTPLMEGNVTTETYADALSEQQTRHDELTALAFPPCLDALRDNLMDTLDALLIAFNTPDAVLIVTEAEGGAPSTSVRQYYTAIADAYDNLAAFVNDLEEQGITLNNGDIGGEVRVVRQYVEINTLECLSSRWLLTEVMPWLTLTETYQQAVNADPVDRDSLRRLVFTLQSEGQRIAGVPYPDCVEDARDYLLEANDALVLVIQGILAGDTGAAGDNMPTYSQALNNLQREVNASIDYLLDN